MFELGKYGRKKIRRESQRDWLGREILILVGRCAGSASLGGVILMAASGEGAI